MKILVLGAGGVGGYFGARLAQSGGDVTFLVRDRRAGQLAAHGLVLRSPLGDLTLPGVRFVTKAAETADLIILSCKAYDLASAMEAISPAVGPGTLILPLLNGLGHLEQLDARFSREKVMGGTCHISVTMNANGDIIHMDPMVRFFHGRRSESQKAEAVQNVLLAGGFAPVLSEDIAQTMWDKFAFLAAYAGITCLMRASIGTIAATDNGAALALALFEECRTVAQASGHALAEDYTASARSIITEPGSPGTSSMLRDLLAGARTEHEHILGDMLRRARENNIPAPVLTIAHAHMQAYAAGQAKM